VNQDIQNERHDGIIDDGSKHSGSNLAWYTKENMFILVDTTQEIDEEGEKNEASIVCMYDDEHNATLKMDDFAKEDEEALPHIETKPSYHHEKNEPDSLTASLHVPGYLNCP
jgi:hypothetical protein